MNIRTLIVIPTFDNPATIAAVVGGLLEATDLPLLVVDDGSRVPVMQTLAALTRAAGSRLTVVRHATNKGKGAALQAAVTWALALDFTHILTIDGDGQHLPADAARLAAAAARNPWSLVIGVRVFPATDVPGSSRFGRIFSNFWVRYETGTAVSDSQSGLRVYPLFPMQGLRFLTTRYDFEVEALTRLLWAGVEVHELPVGVLYPTGDQRVSHFRKGRDNVRISLLNIWLVTVSLFRRHLGRKSLAMATLVAPTLSCLPLHPAAVFGLLVAAALLLQLNGWLCLAWYAVGLTLPEVLRGRFGVDVQGPEWWAVPTVAAALSLTIRVAALGGRQQVQWTGKSRGGRAGNLFFYMVSRWLGRGATYVCLAFITPYFYLFAPRARRASAEYFAAMTPEMTWVRRSGHTVVHFFTFGMVLLDRLFQSFSKEQALAVNVVGRAAVDQAASGGRGVIVLTAHAGGWGLSTRSLVTNQLGRQTVVAEFVANDAATAPVRASEQQGIDRKSSHNEASPILAYKERLEGGQIVAMMADRPMTGKLALVPFLGKLAAFDLTPFRLSLTLGVEVVYCFAFKKDYGSYELAFEAAPPLAVGRGMSKDAVCEEALRHFAGALERQLRRHPHQWFNFYPFFSTRPVAPTAMAAATK